MSINLCSPVNGEIVVWHKKPGDFVKVDESIVDIECGEVVYEIPAPANGILKEVILKTGAIVTANQVIGTFEVQHFRARLVAKLKNIMKRRS